PGLFSSARAPRGNWGKILVLGSRWARALPQPPKRRSRSTLSLPQKALGWTEADGFRLDEGLERYRESGVHDDIRDCATLDDMARLKESLEQLTKTFGLDFAYFIERIDDEMAEREETKGRSSGWTGASRSMEPVDHQVSDEDIRQMFSTLHDVE